MAARKMAKREAGERDRALGEELARELDHMKGMAMKVGQILSYFDGVLPEPAHRALASLQRGTLAVPFSTMSGVIQAAFGAPPGVVFDSFEETPVASASIGQVYRANWKGVPVAVKVQYPNVRSNIDGDFSRLAGLSRLATLASAVDGPAIVEELRSTFVSECDYTLEADNQNMFVAALRGQDDFVVPRAILERTRSTVLTTEWCHGASFDEFLRGAKSENKQRVARLLAHFAHQSFYVFACINADPHPGNYLFPADGRLALIDFGCVRGFEPGFVAQERELVRVVIDDDIDRFEEAIARTGMLATPTGFDFDLHWRMLRHQWEPYCHDSYRITAEYVRQGMAFAGPSNPNLRRLRVPPPWVWLQRLQWGLHSVLSRFDVDVSYRGILREILDRQVQPIQVTAERLASDERGGG
jgi:predicted unusual protein kinase regulating ubiquinone biosynthesis (AarF/ABC1/UbiB family)